MALSLSCSCGYHFEVEETFAGQTVRCPECQQPVEAPAQARQPLRTSGYAVASVVLALVLAFTGVGTILAVICGIVALIQIALHRNQVTGTGYAVFGIVCGLGFTVLFGLSLLRTELFGMEMVREGLMGKQVDRTGPLEISRPERGFAIRRPSTHWGVATREFAQDLVPDSDLVLINLGRDAYIDVTRDSLAGRSLEEYRDQVLDEFKETRNRMRDRRQTLPPRGLTVRSKRTLPATDDRETLEVILDVRLSGQPMTFLIHIIRPLGSHQVYIVRGWAFQRRFSLVDADIRQALASFRILKE